MVVSSWSCLIEKKINLDEQPYHVVEKSPWPFLVSFSLLFCVLSLLYWFTTGKSFLLVISFLQLIFFKAHWFYDIIIESTFEGWHTFHVQKNVRVAMALFILSEILFFFSFFWAFFHYSLVPSIWIGCVWPPKCLDIVTYMGLPLLNTLLLLSSGVSVTYAHRAIYTGNYKKFICSMLITLLFGISFVYCQWFEYNYAQFNISTSIYGSIFYLMTGFHGLHVMIGLILLFVCIIRSLRFQLTREHHTGLECAIWYWHFVDVVWLFLYLFVYIWSAK